MRQRALGFLETLGMIPAIVGTDIMLKAATVDLISYENIGSTLVTIVIEGDVAAVEAAIEVGAKAAAKVGQVTAKNVMARPVEEIGEIVSIYDVDEY